MNLRVLRYELARLMYKAIGAPVYVSVSVPDGVFIGPVQSVEYDPEVGIILSFSEESLNQERCDCGKTREECIETVSCPSKEQVPPASGGT